LVDNTVGAVLVVLVAASSVISLILLVLLVVAGARRLHPGGSMVVSSAEAVADSGHRQHADSERLLPSPPPSDNRLARLRHHKCT